MAASTAAAPVPHPAGWPTHREKDEKPHTAMVGSSAISCSAACATEWNSGPAVRCLCRGPNASRTRTTRRAATTPITDAHRALRSPRCPAPGVAMRRIATDTQATVAADENPESPGPAENRLRSAGVSQEPRSRTSEAPAIATAAEISDTRAGRWLHRARRSDGARVSAPPAG